MFGKPPLISDYCERLEHIEDAFRSKDTEYLEHIDSLEDTLTNETYSGSDLEKIVIRYNKINDDDITEEDIMSKINKMKEGRRNMKKGKEEHEQYIRAAETLRVMFKNCELRMK
jgi:predicted RND superfamily exporter protein